MKFIIDMALIEFKDDFKTIMDIEKKHNLEDDDCPFEYTIEDKYKQILREKIFKLIGTEINKDNFFIEDKELKKLKDEIRILIEEEVLIYKLFDEYDKKEITMEIDNLFDEVLKNRIFVGAVKGKKLNKFIYVMKNDLAITVLQNSEI